MFIKYNCNKSDLYINELRFDDVHFPISAGTKGNE